MLHKQFYVFDEDIPAKIVIRNYHKDDIDQLISIQKESFPPPFPSELWWNENQLENHISFFHEGALCAEIDGKIIGSMTSLIVDFNEEKPEHTWESITDNGYIRNHKNDGNTLYVVDICVSPAYRKLGIGKWLMQSMYETVVHLNLDRLLGGGRIPGFHKQPKHMSVEEYIEAVLKGEVRDPVMTFLLRCGRTPLAAVENYLDDEESRHYGVLMEWRNPFKKKTSDNS
ncbi:GNAT family N-acetyltransferase [Metabacillus fastidiosus]|uniref:GNAT family N-acetyltransferase n=1 Tax=Metabacillus fastidiosus TaxID=1458 RepID=UPI002DBEF543|nr:GNAT family N-acetyltransferase [Metabacillus fastidiosus]MEC2075165.1 GNAT family N-acetyltransferase [Metabacillus fastidiosus]